MKKRKNIIGIVAMFMALCVIVSCILIDGVYLNDHFNKHKLYKESKEIVLDFMKCPSTTKFDMKTFTYTYNDEYKTYTVYGQYDSANGYNAMIRGDFVIVFMDDNKMVGYIEVDNEEMYVRDAYKDRLMFGNPDKLKERVANMTSSRQ